MKTFKNILFTGLLVASVLNVVLSGATIPAHQIVNIILALIAGRWWVKKCHIGARVMRYIGKLIEDANK